MEKVYEFLPSILTLVGIVISLFFYWNFLIRKFYGERLNSLEWLAKNKRKSTLISMPVFVIMVPAVEELIFRFPLVILFDTVSDLGAWYGIFISSGLFAFIHIFIPQVVTPDILTAYERGECISDDVKEESKRIRKKNKKHVNIQRLSRIVFSFLLGLLAGYFAIKYQSIWVALGIHAGWNLFISDLVLLSLLLAEFIYEGITVLISGIKIGYKKIFAR